ncbi:MAG: M14 family murein peptide amidase A [Magnetococcus sp. YQC-9]
MPASSPLCHPDRARRLARESRFGSRFGCRAAMVIGLIICSSAGVAWSEDPSNLSAHDAMEAIAQDAFKGNPLSERTRKTEKSLPQVSMPDMCAKIGTKLRSVDPLTCQKFNLIPTGAVSVNGLPIFLKEYPPNPARPPQARILLLGGIHGDEYSSISIVFKWMEILNAHHSGLFHWRIAPLVNPDGLLREQSQRTNARGVDLNRNFPTMDWHRESREYWLKKTNSDPRRFPGQAPLSEPESRWIAEEIERFRPNVIISVHAPFGLLDFDGPPTTPPERLGALYLTLLGTYPGSLGRYAGIQKKLPIITIELPLSGALPNTTEIATMWSDMVRWIRSNVRDRGQIRTFLSERPLP